MYKRQRQFRALINDLGDGVTPAQGAIAFALAQSQINTVLVGARTETELQEDLAALDLSLTPSMVAKLSQLAVDDEEMLDPSTWGIP